MSAFTQSDKSSKFIIIYLNEEQTSALALNPEDISIVRKIAHMSSKPSKNDDFIFVQSSNDNEINYYDLSNGPKSVKIVKDSKSAKEC